MFRGRYEHTIDAKGRLALPSAFRKELGDQIDDPLIVTTHISSPCLVAYPLKEWERFEEQLAKLPQFEPSVMKLRRLYVGGAMECPVDKQGRVLIPPVLREYAKLERESYWVGAMRAFEVWSKPSWHEVVERERETVDKEVLTKLGELGISAVAGNIHASVLLGEVVTALAPRAGGVYVDATCGLGGHSEAILEAASPDGRLLAVDRDPNAIELAAGRLARFGDRATIVEGHFSDLGAHMRAKGLHPADGLLADLGVSSLQLDDAARGFSFMRAGPLDMRMGPSVGATAAELIEKFDVEELARVLRDFGEENRARPLARAIVEARDRGALRTTAELASVIERASGGRKSSPIHPATRAFQAIRIAVNRELDELEKLIASLADLVRPGGRVAIISFHSLEDRMVKHAFEEARPAPQPRGLPVEPKRTLGPWKALTKKPITSGEAEIEANPRSRSAKLRVAERRGEES